MSSDFHPCPFPDPAAAPNGSNPTSTSAAAAAAAAATTTKRQRRPSVRLGDIGEPPAAASDPPSFRRPSGGKNPLKLPFKPNPNPNPNRNRSRRAPRSRSSWTSSASKMQDYDEDGVGEEEEEEGFRSDFDGLRHDREESPTRSERYQLNDKDDRNGTLGLEEEEDGSEGRVQSWLNRLGLGRYAPVFEIHEVDDEVLPLLTLEDLKDMGISAVGSRRKMFTSIQKLKNKKDF